MPELPDGLLVLLLDSWSGLSFPDFPLLLFTFGILPRLWWGCTKGEILPSLDGDGDLSLSLARFRESDFSNLAPSFSSFPLENVVDLDELEPDLLLDLDDELDLEEEDFLESDF